MALSNAERQRRYKAKIKAGELRTIGVVLPLGEAIKLDYLAKHWRCARTEALGRILMDAWHREGRPIPGYDADGEPIPDSRAKVTG